MPKCRRHGYIARTFSQVPNAHNGEKLRNGYLNPAYVGVQIWAQWLHSPYLLGGPECSALAETQQWRVDPACPGGAKSGHTAYVTHALSGVPTAQHGEQIR